LRAAMLPAFTNASFTLVGMWAIERFGRRKLLLSSLVATGASLFLIGMLFNTASRHTPPFMPGDPSDDLSCPAFNPATPPHLADCNSCIRHACVFCGPSVQHHHLSQNRSQATCVIASVQAIETCENQQQQPKHVAFQNGCPSTYTGWIVAALMIYLASFAPGLSPVPWAVNSEIYPDAYRGYGNGFASVTNWLANSLVTLLFLPLGRVLPAGGCFFLSCGCTAIGFVLSWFYLPETRGLSFADIQRVFRARYLSGDVKEF